MSKILPSLREAIIQSGLQDGMCVSFHHHLRGGDYVLNMVMNEIANLGIKNIKINASSIHDGHTPLIEHMKNEVVTALETDYIGPAVGRAISEGILQNPVIFRTHGSRSSVIESGESQIDVAFLGVSAADCMGNGTGKIGRSACGSLGYAFADAYHAKKVVIVTDNIVPYPLCEASITENYVDFVVKVDAIGNPEGIVSGTTRLPKDPIAWKIASYASKVIAASGLLQDGFSFQTGAGGASLAVAAYLKEIMLREQIHGSYALGGITGYIVDMLEAGCFQAIQDVQCFDLKAIESIRKNKNHFEISASRYASPTVKSSAASSLDVVVLGATQIDIDFNVNVHTDSNGNIIGGSGGHTDVAECAKMSIIVAPLSRARMSIVLDHVGCISTPGRSIDVLVTQCGVCVNPLRSDLRERFIDAKLPIIDIRQLKLYAEELNGIPSGSYKNTSRVVANVYNRDGSLLDKIYQVSSIKLIC